jgi:hypothetical protein
MSFWGNFFPLGTGLGSQSIELFGRIEGLDLAALHLTFLDFPRQLELSNGVKLRFLFA